MEKEIDGMKKIIFCLAASLMVCMLASCAGITHCKECDKEVYQDGYCEYHYILNTAKDTVDDAAHELYDSVFGG